MLSARSDGGTLSAAVRKACTSSSEGGEALTPFFSLIASVMLAINNIVGYVFAINGKITGGDVYASSALFRKMWRKLIIGRFGRQWNTWPVRAASQIKSQQRWKARRGLSSFSCCAMAVWLPLNSAKTITNSSAPLSQ